MDIQPGNAQWQGTRDEQQDAFGFIGFDNPGLCAHAGVMLVLADGMGGMSGGRQASLLAVERMMAAYGAKRADEPIPRALERALQAANQAVYALARAGAGEGQVGTTLVAVVARGAELHWVGVGDSRLYHYRAADDTLTQCTDDHTYANQLLRRVAAGALSPEAAAGDPDRQALASFLGLSQIPEVDRNVHPVHLAPGDRLLVVSDGVYGVLPEAELKALVRQDPQAAADALIQAVRALARPEQDNATAALLGLADAGRARDPAPGLPVRAAAVGQGARPVRGKRPVIALSLALLALLLAAALGGYLLWSDDGPAAPPAVSAPQAPGTPGLTPPSATATGIEAGTGSGAGSGTGMGRGTGASQDTTLAPVPAPQPEPGRPPVRGAPADTGDAPLPAPPPGEGQAKPRGAAAADPARPSIGSAAESAAQAPTGKPAAGLDHRSGRPGGGWRPAVGRPSGRPGAPQSA